jgi:hypothetical protein
MHIIEEDNQQNSDDCKCRTDIPEFLTHVSASAATKLLQISTRLSWHINTKTVFKHTKYSDLGCPFKGQGYSLSFKNAKLFIGLNKIFKTCS